MAVSLKFSAGQLTVLVSGGSGNPRDWVGLFRATDGNAPTKYDWRYLANDRQSPTPTIGRAANTVHLTITDPTGDYEVRLMSASGQSSYAVIERLGEISFPAVTILPPPPPPPGSSTAFVASATLGSLRNDFSGNVGVRFSVGTQNLTITALGRYVAAGNSQAHTLRLIDGATGLGVPGGSVTVGTTGVAPGQFSYADLANTVVLTAGATYRLLSTETSGGDRWLSNDTALVTTPAASVLGASYTTEAAPTDYHDFTTPNASYGPLNFRHEVGGVASGLKVGSPFKSFPNMGVYISAYQPIFKPVLTSATRSGAAGVGLPVSGTATFTGSVVYARGSAPALAANTVTMQMLVDNVPVGSRFTGPPFAFSLDTTSLSDGTHSVSFRCVDCAQAGLPAYHIKGTALILLVQNTAAMNGPQRLPLIGWPANSPVIVTRVFSPVADFIQFAGGGTPNNVVHAYPVQTIPGSNSPSLRGTITTQPGPGFYAESVTSPFWDQYEGPTVLSTTRAGGVFAQMWNMQSQIRIEDAYPGVIHFPLLDGGRGNNMVDAYTTYVDDPDGETEWYCVSLAGRVFIIDHDGHVTTTAGWSTKRSRVWWDHTDTTQSTADLDDGIHSTFLGTIGSPSFSASNMRGLNDLCFDPRDEDIFYLANAMKHFIIKVDRHTSPPTLTRYAGQEARAGYVDGNATTIARFDQPYSIVMADGIRGPDPVGTMYVADAGNRLIRKITPDGSTVSTLVGHLGLPASGTQALSNVPLYSPNGTVTFANTYLCGKFFIRISSQGKLVVGEYFTSCIRVLDLAAQTTTRSAVVDRFGNSAPHEVNWLQIDVDAAGMVGPVDDVLSASGNEIYWRNSLVAGGYAGVLADEHVTTAEGNASAGYPWTVAISRHQGRFLLGGISGQGSPNSWRIRQPGDPQNYNYDRAVYNSGYLIWELGTVHKFPWGARPSMIPLGARGLTHAGLLSFDDINAAYPTDGALTTYIQSGMMGSTSRPELTGNDLRDLIYFVRLSSLAGAGVPSGTVVMPGAVDPDITPPLIGKVVATRINATTIQVTWTTDKAAIGLVAVGTPSDVGSDAPYSWWALETAYATSHSVAVTGCSTALPTHFAVMAKSMAGYCAYTADQSVA